jgi:hypothetical protein
MKARTLITLSAVAWLSLTGSQMALAQGVGNLGSLPTVFPQTGTPPNGWIVTSTAGSIPVVLDPLGPAWGKSFTDPNGGNFSYPLTSPNNPPLNVQEFLVVAPNSPPWTDWHEDVVGIDASGAPDPGWAWANPSLLVNGVPAPGLTVTGAGTNSLSFFFNPIFPGDQVIIRKQLVYNGLPGTTFVGTLAVHEYPTPEPATIGLLALGGLAMLRRRTSHRGQTGVRRNTP